MTDIAQLENVAATLLRDEPAFLSSRDFGPFVRQGKAPGPSVLIGDQSVIELYSGAQGSMLDYRMALLGGSGDIAIVRRRSKPFEAYLQRHLGRGCPDFLQAEADDLAPVARQCRVVPRLRDALAERLVQSGTLTLQSYLTTGHDWRLAKALGEHASLPVHVHGAAPRIGRRSNDKLWFWRLARRVVGDQGVPPSFHAYGPAAAAAQVASIKAMGKDAIIKVPSSAGSTGNVRLTQAVLERLDLKQIRAMILTRLQATGWQGKYPVLVGVWESGVAQSPSAQMFLPLNGDGNPVVKGLFEQRVTGPGGEFVGAVPAVLAPNVEQKMRHEATRLAIVLQSLGYFGWCSFDAILRDDGALHWIECNGRWSGVSIPLTAATQWLGHQPRGIVIAQDHLPRPPLPFDDLLTRLDGLLLEPGNLDRGVILTAPQNTAAPVLSFNAVAIAGDQTAAEAVLEDARARLR